MSRLTILEKASEERSKTYVGPAFALVNSVFYRKLSQVFPGMSLRQRYLVAQKGFGLLKVTLESLCLD
jgi:hypothetical protein